MQEIVASSCWSYGEVKCTTEISAMKEGVVSTNKLESRMLQAQSQIRNDWLLFLKWSRIQNLFKTLDKVGCKREAGGGRYVLIGFVFKYAGTILHNYKLEQCKCC